MKLELSRRDPSVPQFLAAVSAIREMDAGAGEAAVYLKLIPGVIHGLARLRDDDRLWSERRVSPHVASAQRIQEIVWALSNARQDMVLCDASNAEEARSAIRLAAELSEAIGDGGMLSYDIDRHRISIQMLELARRAADAFGEPAPAFV